MEPQRSSLLSIPGAIIVAGALVAMAIIWTQKPVARSSGETRSNVLAPAQLAPVNMAPVTASDHILGNPNASIKIVEYSDPSCPFCKLFNPTMTQIMSEYGGNGQVAWIYRSFPFDKPDQNGNILHPNAGREAQGLECAAALGGNAKFWVYEKEWYNVFPQDGANRSSDVDNAQMAQVAKDSGIDVGAFSDCLSSGRFKDKVESQYQDGIAAGVSGTPTSFIITPSGNNLPIVGAQPYATVKSTIEALLGSTK